MSIFTFRNADVADAVVDWESDEHFDISLLTNNLITRDVCSIGTQMLLVLAKCIHRKSVLMFMI